ncbi:MAG: HAMP domain-containing histidine kinase [Muribaculaceae bacterium]|nr:HAMP domain-containing histidine kinase [Muribaculaceae bacterium]
MASKGKSKWHMVPMAWLIGAIFTSFGAGICFAYRNPWWIFLSICSITCTIAMIRRVAQVQKRLRYVMEATLSGDFSYNFPTEDVDVEQMEINQMLNRLVEHFEKLTIEVRQNEAFLGHLINLTDIGLAVADAKGEVRLHNEAALRLLERHAWTNICQISKQAYIDLDIRKSEVTVNDKRFTLITITDLSRRLQAVEVESWEKLTRVLTHEIMNSLTPIQSIAETMSGKATTQDVSDAFNTISSSSGSLMHFVRNFREFSQLPSPRMRTLYLKPLLESCLTMADGYAQNKDITITLTCFPPDLMVYTDEALLRQVILNIIKNAVEAEPKTITMEAQEKADESIEIRISNDGEPISEETAHHIFTPFFTTRESGNGIGLSLSRRIVTHLGGTLTFKTIPVTSFSVKL